MNWNNVSPYAPVILKLLNGPVYTTNREWSTLASFPNEVHEFFERMALRLNFFEEEGFAYLSQDRWEDLDESVQINLRKSQKIEHLPVLISRRILSDEQTLLCVLLREQYDEIDQHIIGEQKIFELLRDFYSEQLNKQKEEKHFHQLVQQIVDLGFLTNLNASGTEQFYKIEAILKAKFDLATVREARNKLISYYTPDHEQ